MKIFDMHIHSRGSVPCPERLISEMDKAGVYGGCVFSNRPTLVNEKTGSDFETRMNEVLGWA